MLVVESAVRDTAHGIFGLDKGLSHSWSIVARYARGIGKIHGFVTGEVLDSVAEAKTLTPVVHSRKGLPVFELRALLLQRSDVPRQSRTAMSPASARKPSLFGCMAHSLARLEKLHHLCGWAQVLGKMAKEAKKLRADVENGVILRLPTPACVDVSSGL